jgi:methylenetetrahydrofolate dehydrogenase (NADP+)/methenyltetrahydrofolate cyclohydrolase
MGKLMSGDATDLLPCTPQGIRHLIRSTQRPLTGMRALVIGRSRLVGIPTAHLLLQENCTVTVAHSYSQDLPDLCHQSDIIIAACGQPQLIQGSWLKSHTIVIDVGIHRLPSGELVGDVAASTLQDPSIYLSPVPGGVGPLTVAFLLKNTVFAAKNK